jgi:hypothetical protein
VELYRQADNTLKYISDSEVFKCTCTCKCLEWLSHDHSIVTSLCKREDYYVRYTGCGQHIAEIVFLKLHNY